METMLKSVTEKTLRTVPADFKYHMDNIAPKDHQVSKIISFARDNCEFVIKFGLPLELNQQHAGEFFCSCSLF